MVKELKDLSSTYLNHLQDHFLLEETVHTQTYFCTLVFVQRKKQEALGYSEKFVVMILFKHILKFWKYVMQLKKLKKLRKLWEVNFLTVQSSKEKTKA